VVVAAILGAGALVGQAAPAGAAQPTIERGSNQETFQDDFLFDLCGIETRTTLVERWTLKERSDGSSTLHVVRTFTSEDPRIPIEKGAATTFTAADGSRRVVGKPLQLIGPSGGVRIIDAGWVEFDANGDPSDVRGPHPSLGADLADYYCPG